MFEAFENQGKVGSTVISSSARFLMALNDKYNGNLVLTHDSRGFAIQRIGEARKQITCCIIADPETADEFGWSANLEHKLWADYRGRKNPFAKVAAECAKVEFKHHDKGLIMADSMSNRDRLMAVVHEGECCYIMLRNGHYVPICEDDLREMASIERPISPKTWERVAKEANEQYNADAKASRAKSAKWSTYDLGMEFRDWMDELWANHDGMHNPEDAELCAVEMFENEAIALYKQAKTLRERAAILQEQLMDLRARYQQVAKQPKSSTRDAQLNSMVKRGVQMKNAAFKMAFDAEIIKERAGKNMMMESSVERYRLERLAGGFEEQIFTHGGLLREMTLNGWDVILSGADTRDGESLWDSIVESFEATV